MSEKTPDDGGPAFPRGIAPDDPSGMSLRDWFAGQALAGIINSAPAQNMAAEYGEPFKVYAALSYAHADAMLAERAKGGS